MTVEFVWATPNAEAMITAMARVSAPQNQNNMETAPRLLAYLIKHKHWSPFEMANLCVKIRTERDISAQILRHRSFSFQEYCLAGNARITIKTPEGAVQRIPIKELYLKFKKPTFKARIARAYDAGLNRFINAEILNVYSTGLKEVYEYTIQSSSNANKIICCTKEHKVYTKEKGFVDFDIAYKNNLTIGLNGKKAEPLQYQLKENIEKYAWMGSTAYAEHFKIAPVTARKWFREHGIYPEKPNHASKARLNLNFNSKLCSFMKWARKECLKTTCENCNHNGSENRLELSHIFSHDKDPVLAFNENNLQTLCSKCHRQFDIECQSKRYGWTLGMKAKWGKITQVKYLGLEETYDIEMNHSTHNFIADGIIVHNSTRYAEAQSYTVPAFRRQDTANRQNSIDDLSQDMKNQLAAMTEQTLNQCEETYQTMLRLGVAKETARRILPLCTKTTLYMNGSLRSWIHYLELRTDKATQLEHRVIAEEIKQIFQEQFPIIANVIFN